MEHTRSPTMEMPKRGLDFPIWKFSIPLDIFSYENEIYFGSLSLMLFPFSDRIQAVFASGFLLVQAFTCGCKH